MIERSDMQKLAALSRIAVPEAELESVGNEIETILEYVSQIQEVAAEEAGPEAGEVRNVMREDANPHETGAFTEALLAAVPGREGKYVKVKKIL